MFSVQKYQNRTVSGFDRNSEGQITNGIEHMNLLRSRSSDPKTGLTFQEMSRGTGEVIAQHDRHGVRHKVLTKLEKIEENKKNKNKEEPKKYPKKHSKYKNNLPPIADMNRPVNFDIDGKYLFFTQDEKKPLTFVEKLNRDIQKKEGRETVKTKREEQQKKQGMSGNQIKDSSDRIDKKVMGKRLTRNQADLNVRRTGFNENTPLPKLEKNTLLYTVPDEIARNMMFDREVRRNMDIIRHKNRQKYNSIFDKIDDVDENFV